VNGTGIDAIDPDVCHSPQALFLLCGRTTVGYSDSSIHMTLLTPENRRRGRLFRVTSNTVPFPSTQKCQLWTRLEIHATRAIVIMITVLSGPSPLSRLAKRCVGGDG